MLGLDPIEALSQHAERADLKVQVRDPRRRRRQLLFQPRYLGAYTFLAIAAQCALELGCRLLERAAALLEPGGGGGCLAGARYKSIAGAFWRGCLGPRSALANGL